MDERTRIVQDVSHFFAPAIRGTDAPDDLPEFDGDAEEEEAEAAAAAAAAAASGTSESKGDA